MSERREDPFRLSSFTPPPTEEECREAAEYALERWGNDRLAHPPVTVVREQEDPA